MDTIVSNASKVNQKSPDSVYSNRLIQTFNNYAGKIKILSLDCFDTLLWRKTAEPTDVFYDLEKKPTFKSYGISKLIRTEAERTASKLNQIKHASTQVTLKDIYRAHLPDATDEELSSLIKEEIAAEVDACYSYPPIIELIRSAHAKKLKIVIVSDTYLTKSELRYLLSKKLPADILSMIDDIFCSCEHGKSKTEGLFAHVIKSVDLPPALMLHIGDNPIADFRAAKQAKMQAIHLLHHHDTLQEVLRMQHVAACFMDTTIRNTRSLATPFRGLLAAELTTPTPENLIGYATAGPILYAFGKFILDEVKALENNGIKPKVLFLLRDGYLPSLVCEAIADKAIGKSARISRFGSYAASFRTKADVERYLASNSESLRFEDICHQLLLSKSATVQILNCIEKKKDQVAEFNRLICQPSVLNQIFQASTAYRERLKKYLIKTIDLKPGDTLVFVDLGYTGTSQIKLAPIFKEEMNVDILGRYLIALRTHETANWKASRKGLIDPSYYDDNALVALVTYIALFEQICTNNDKSVINYDNEGNPIFSEINLGKQQQLKMEAIQSEVLRFVRRVATFSYNAGIEFSSEALRDVASTNLARLIYFLSKPEREYLQSFQFELNLGTKDILSLIDVGKGLTNLRKRGWLHCLKESQNKKRMNYPAECRAINFNLALGLIAEHRFGIKVAVNDLSHQRELLEITALENNQVQKFEFTANPTYDGYYAALIPVVNNHSEIGITFGKSYQWVEIDSAELIQLPHLHSDNESQYTVDASQQLTVNNMVAKSGGLFECLTTNAMLILVPNKQVSNMIFILRVIFRPIVRRDS